MFIVVIVIGLISILVNFSVQNRFQEFVIHKQKKQTEEILNLISLSYKDSYDWDTNYLEIVGMNALQNGMIIKIDDKNNQNIWSANEHNHGLCQDMITNMWNNMNQYSGKWEGRYQEKTYPIISNDAQIGTLTTGFVGPYYFTDEELIFIEALNHLFLGIGICSLVLAFGLGILMSYRISRPLNKVANKAILLSQGKYKDRLTVNSKTKEINILIHTINNLSDALEHKEELRKQLTQDVAHELRTPLTSVLGTLEAMLDGIWDMDKERLSSCYDEIIRIKRLIGSIEDLSKVENDNVLLHKESFDLSKLLRTLLSNFESEFVTKNISVDYNQQSIYLYADQDKISQVFRNLISNAIKYSDNGGKVHIHITEYPENVEIRIKDSGIGMSDADLPHIFERFYRADKSRNRETGGVGIGLTITKAIIEAHDGTIDARSKLGEGTEFMIVLPKKRTHI
jgi:signal transduction histidine kinase